MKLLAFVMAVGVAVAPQAALASWPTSFTTGASAAAAVAQAQQMAHQISVSAAAAGSAAASASGGSASAVAASTSAVSIHAGFPFHHDIHFHRHDGHIHRHDHAELTLEKTDNRDGITRPGHMFMYTLKVSNTGDDNIHDLKVTDTIPDAFRIESVSDGSSISGQTVRWANVNLEAGASRTFEITVRVKNDAPLTEVCNTATAKSEDHDLSVSDGECITIASGGQVKAVVRVQPTPVLVQPAAQPTPTVAGIPVPITAQTGAGMLGISAGAALLGALGLYWRRRIG